jgi:hypothetical protein
MKRFAVSLTAIAFLLVNAGAAIACDFTGCVYCGDNPIEGVTVTFVHQYQTTSATTGADGCYSIHLGHWGTWTITLDEATLPPDVTCIDPLENPVVVNTSEAEGYDYIQDWLIDSACCGLGAGCTPGYWKNHLEDWLPTGYDPGDDFDATFGVDLFDPDITLEEAVWARGGGVNKLARHGTAALLGAAYPDVNYPLTEDEVIDAVQTGDADTLVEYNELGCPL